MTVLVIDNFDSFTFNLVQMLQAQTDWPVVTYRNNAITFDEIIALKPERIVISPGPGHPASPNDVGICAEVIQRQSELKNAAGQMIPVLGVCLGHQLIVHCYGGKIIQAPTIMHGKRSMVTINKSDSTLLQNLPNPFEAMRYHSWTASPEDFPGSLTITATTEETQASHSLNIIMACQHKTLPLYGVQFHPESIGTPEGNTLLQNFVGTL